MPISAISDTDIVNSIPMIEKHISIKKEAFNSFNKSFPSILFLIKSMVFERKKEIHIANAAINIEIKTGNRTIIMSQTLIIKETRGNLFCIKDKTAKATVNTKGIIESFKNCFSEYDLKAAFHDNSYKKSDIKRLSKP